MFFITKDHGDICHPFYRKNFVIGWRRRLRKQQMCKCHWRVYICKPFPSEMLDRLQYKYYSITCFPFVQFFCCLESREMKRIPRNSIPLLTTVGGYYTLLWPCLLYIYPQVFSSAGARSGSGMKLKVKTKSIAYTGGQTRMCLNLKARKMLYVKSVSRKQQEKSSG